MDGSEFGNLAGRRVVVTGSSTGIGRAIAWELACGGADVVIHCRQRVQQAEALQSQIQQLGRKATVCIADLSDARALQHFAEQAYEALGGADVWVNNAGADLLTGNQRQLTYEEKLQRLCAVDLRATMLLSRIVGARMAAADGGVILNMGWDQAQRGMEGESGELFAAAKNSIMGFTRSLALSLAPRVRVNCIAPGWIRTAWGNDASQYWQDRVRDETPLKRWGQPEDVARLARFLASDDASFITGQVVNINGGAVR